MGIVTTIKLRSLRSYYRSRAKFAHRELRFVQDNTRSIAADDILLICTFRNEKPRLEYFLNYYRALGVQHFLFIDNDSDDGSDARLLGQEDVSLWQTNASYRKARFGVDWVNALLDRHGVDHWCLCVDADEFFIYPHHESRKLHQLTHWLDHKNKKSFGAMLLDLYPKGPIEMAHLTAGQNPMEVCKYFDLGNLRLTRDPLYHALWIQGGVRERAFFAHDPKKAPALNKVPLVRWAKGFAYVSSTHHMLPRACNKTYGTFGHEAACGLLLHPKFIASFADNARAETQRNEHYAQSGEYAAYAARTGGGLVLWHENSQALEDWRALEKLGLMTRGSWI